MNFSGNITLHCANTQHIIPSNQLQFHEVERHERNSGPEVLYQAEDTVNGLHIVVNVWIYTDNFINHVEIQTEQTGCTGTSNLTISEND